MNKILITPALNVFEHMALDEETVRFFTEGVFLRFYRWSSEKALTFGYSQNMGEVEKAMQIKAFQADFTRRPTGGGIVYHEGDLTFSLVFSSRATPSDIYAGLHSFIQAELAKTGAVSQRFDLSLPATAYAPSVNHQASACFIRPVENDLLAQDGQKILGGAIRRFGERVLYQGSLQYASARENTVFKKAIILAVRNFLATDMFPCRVPEKLLSAARILAKNQYCTDSWKRKF